MQTPVDHYGFALPAPPLNFNPQPGTPFNDAVINAGQLSVVEVERVKQWPEIMPMPAFDSTLKTLPYVATGQKGFTGQSIGEQRAIWERDASGFVNRCKERIRLQMALLEREFRQNLEQAAIEKRPIAVTPDLIAAKWRGKHSMSMAEFDRLTITAALVKPFWIAFAQKWEDDRGLHPERSSRQGNSLTGREQILIYFYEGGKMILRNDPKYNKYITWSTKHKRLAYYNNSQSKLKKLIASIEKLIPHLTEKAKQDADSELNTLKGHLFTEK